MDECLFCREQGGEALWSGEHCRIIWPKDPEYPGLLRVVWQAHVKEMSDLEVQQRTHLMKVVFATESALRAVLRPDKMNLASFGNVVPHLHWHVIPRFTDDAYFPNPFGGLKQRESSRTVPGDFAAAVKRALAAVLI
ncbi:MAG: HIT family protein [Betaproteobacteria bacterium]|nr:HIT family protein [Betaproteobacteria bacterium]